MDQKRPNLKPGEIREIGGKVYGLCFDCRKLVRVDKPLFGSLHLCVEDRP